MGLEKLRIKNPYNLNKNGKIIDKKRLKIRYIKLKKGFVSNPSLKKYFY